MKSKKNRPGKKVDTSGINADVLNKWMQQDQVRWNAVKCQALIALSKGVSVTEICKVLNVTRESIRLWRICLNKKGLQGFVAHNKKGKVSNLTNEVKANLQEVISMDPVKVGYKEKKWTGKLVTRYLKEKLNITIAVRTAQNWMKSIENL